eukprot:6260582-Prymnesium_polylepis.1
MLGHGDNERQNTPKAIEALRGVRVGSIATGHGTSLAVAASGVAYGWGFGRDERLGLERDDNQLVPLQYPSEQVRVKV